MYNDTSFTKPPPTHTKQQIDKPSNSINQYLQTEHKIEFTSTYILHWKTKITPHDIINNTINEPLLPQTTNLDDRIKQSKNNLFLISYSIEGTLLSRWYIIQVDLDIIFKTNPANKFNHQYYYVFYIKHDRKKEKSDKYSRWCPEWWTYTIDPSSNINIYQQPIQFPPTRKPDYNKFIQWADMVDMSDTAAIIGPSNFEPISSTNNTRSNVRRNAWKIWHKTCTHSNMLPLHLRYQTSHQPSIQKLSRTRKRKSSAN